MSRRLVLLLGALTASVVLAFASVAQAAPAPKRLRGTVGPGFTISLAKKSVRAGRYVITIRDRSNIHNFHLRGPGVNKKTGVAFVGTVKWKVRLKKGKTYRFVCDPHRATMKGTLKIR